MHVMDLLLNPSALRENEFVFIHRNMDETTILFS